jgi:para-aminobenzoate synthetase component 1
MPLVTELRPAPDPFGAFLRLAHLPGVVFLDSAARDPVWGRFSYLSAAPFEYLTARGSEARVEAPASPAIDERARREIPGLPTDPFRLAAARLERWRAPAEAGLPPFQGGAAGLFGYGLSRWVERLPPFRRDEFAVPDLALGLHDWVLAWDHEVGSAWLIAHGFPEEDTWRREKRAARRTREVLELLARAAPGDAGSPAMNGESEAPPLAAREVGPAWPVAGPEGLASNFSRLDYVRAVERAIEYIRAGDIFQVNLSQRLIHPLREPPVRIYGRLRARNPAAFGGYLAIGGAAILSSSPEQFLALSGRDVVTRPIKGTRPRGYTPEADGWGREALRESEKDRAENVMIVDLLRNDLSRVSKPHTVEVPKLFELERHPTVHHMVSEVRGELRESVGANDLLRAAFPGGSITGAPKVRAMEIIAELEPTARGAYCGSLGWIGWSGDLGLNILIRTMTAARGWIQLPAGGGIVALSNPEVEYQETLHKAEGMVRALVE